MKKYYLDIRLKDGNKATCMARGHDPIQAKARCKKIHENLIAYFIPPHKYTIETIQPNNGGVK